MWYKDTVTQKKSLAQSSMFLIFGENSNFYVEELHGKNYSINLTELWLLKSEVNQNKDIYGDILHTMFF